MEVLVRYCSIPGYNKLCCDSCSRRRGTLSSLLVEAAEMDQEVRFAAASQLLETQSPNGTRDLSLRSLLTPSGSSTLCPSIRHAHTVPPRKSSFHRRVPSPSSLAGRNLSIMMSSLTAGGAVQSDATEGQSSNTLRESRLLKETEVALTEVER